MTASETSKEPVPVIVPENEPPLKRMQEAESLTDQSLGFFVADKINHETYHIAFAESLSVWVEYRPKLDSLFAHKSENLKDYLRLLGAPRAIVPTEQLAHFGNDKLEASEIFEEIKDG